MINPLPSQGDIVDVTLKGVQVTHVEAAMPGFSAVVYVSVPKTDKVGGGGNTVFLYANSPHVTATVAERAVPAEWPPQAGDLWRDRDQELWFALDVNSEADDPAGPCIEFVPSRGTGHEEPDEVHRQWGPMTLVHREQADEKPEPVVEAFGTGWPPQVGDRWADSEGDTWMAVATLDGVRLRLYEGHPPMGPADVLARYGPMKLVQR